MPLLNDPTRGNVRNMPSVFQQADERQRQQQLAQLKMRILQAQVQKAEGTRQPFQPPPGFDLAGVSVSPSGVTQRFAPPGKPKVFNIKELNDELFKISHTKKDKKVVEITPSSVDLTSLRIAAEQSGFVLRAVPTAPKLTKRGFGVKRGGVKYILVPKPSPKVGVLGKTPQKPIDVRRLTDAQLDDIIRGR